MIASPRPGRLVGPITDFMVVEDDYCCGLIILGRGGWGGEGGEGEGKFILKDLHQSSSFSDTRV